MIAKDILLNCRSFALQYINGVGESYTLDTYNTQHSHQYYSSLAVGRMAQPAY